jgi:hypothetical protein
MDGVFGAASAREPVSITMSTDTSKRLGRTIHGRGETLLAAAPHGQFGPEGTRGSIRPHARSIIRPTDTGGLFNQYSSVTYSSVLLRCIGGRPGGSLRRTSTFALSIWASLRQSARRAWFLLPPRPIPTAAVIGQP